MRSWFGVHPAWLPLLLHAAAVWCVTASCSRFVPVCCNGRSAESPADHWHAGSSCPLKRAPNRQCVTVHLLLAAAPPSLPPPALPPTVPAAADSAGGCRIHVHRHTICRDFQSCGLCPRRARCVPGGSCPAAGGAGHLGSTCWSAQPWRGAQQRRPAPCTDRRSGPAKGQWQQQQLQPGRCYASGGSSSRRGRCARGGAPGQQCPHELQQLAGQFLGLAGRRCGAACHGLVGRFGAACHAPTQGCTAPMVALIRAQPCNPPALPTTTSHHPSRALSSPL